jgi:hypothetical protein
MTPLEEIKSEVADLFQRRETAGVDGMQMKIYYIWTSQIARKLEEYVGLLEAESQSLKAELAKRPAIAVKAYDEDGEFETTYVPLTEATNDTA